MSYKKPTKSARVIDRTKTKIFLKLCALTNLQITNWLEPHFNKLAQKEEAEISTLRSMLLDPKRFDALFTLKAPKTFTYIRDHIVNRYSIEHAPFRGEGFLSSDPKFDKNGVLCGTDLLTPEEVTNAYRMEHTAYAELSPWLKQFEPAEGWTDQMLGAVCALSPLFRSCLVTLGYNLRVYKHGPRNLWDIKPMSPELVHALQVAANLPDREREY